LAPFDETTIHNSYHRDNAYKEKQAMSIQFE